MHGVIFYETWVISIAWKISRVVIIHADGNKLVLCNYIFFIKELFFSYVRSVVLMARFQFASVKRRLAT
jgi:hypothetical protein